MVFLSPQKYSLCCSKGPAVKRFNKQKCSVTILITVQKYFAKNFKIFLCTDKSVNSKEVATPVSRRFWKSKVYSFHGLWFWGYFKALCASALLLLNIAHAIENLAFLELVHFC